MAGVSKEPWNSDLQTLAVAQALSESYQDVFVGFIKRTNGMHFWDEKLSPKQLLALLKKASHEKQIFYQRVVQRCQAQVGNATYNPRLPVVTTSELLAGEICRFGRDEQDDHVIELAAIRYLHEQAIGVRHVGIVRHTHVHLLAEMVKEPVEEHEYSLIRRGIANVR